MRLIVTPERCYLPASLEKGGKRWGFATHVYTLRSSRDWGMGDFGSLTDLVDVSAKLGAASIGVNPLHALFPEIPERASPYSPSSRLFLNPLYLDVESVSGFEPGTGTDVKTASVESGKKSKESKGILVDYTAVTKKKFAALKNAHDCFKRKLRASDDHSEADEAYSSFRKESGERLRRFAIFEALSEHFEGKPWQDWPTPYRDRSKQGEHQTVLLGWTGDNGDPDNFLYVLLGCEAAKDSANRARWCYKPFDDLLIKAKQTANVDERTELYRKAQEIFKEEAPWVTIAHSVVFKTMRKEVDDFRIDPFGGHIFYGVDLKE